MRGGAGDDWCLYRDAGYEGELQVILDGQALTWLRTSATTSPRSGSAEDACRGHLELPVRVAVRRGVALRAIR
ncbi:hypothetical protein [Streptomyces sp. UG1]|uniref:hypothetical protein n=1 Tax=Streptomyces sp. UG1 TaxID=3417652 RepID=UPI003CF29C8B